MAHERNVESALCVVQVLSYAKVFVSYIEPVCYFVCCHIVFLCNFGCKITQNTSIGHLFYEKSDKFYVILAGDW